MADELFSIPEHYVTDPDGPGLLFLIFDDGVFAAAHSKEEGTAADEPSLGLLLWEGGHLESVLEDY